ncbi:MAG: hypothetical protein QM765_03605 [Myxococcales bacterium]
MEVLRGPGEGGIQLHVRALAAQAVRVHVDAPQRHRLALAVVDDAQLSVPNRELIDQDLPLLLPARGRLSLGARQALRAPRAVPGAHQVDDRVLQLHAAELDVMAAALDERPQANRRPGIADLGQRRLPRPPGDRQALQLGGRREQRQADLPHLDLAPQLLRDAREHVPLDARGQRRRVVQQDADEGRRCEQQDEDDAAQHEQQAPQDLMPSERMSHSAGT